MRLKIKVRKSLLEPHEKESAGRRVFSSLRSMAAFLMADNILLYHSLADEVPTQSFFDDLPEGKHYFLPRVNGPDLEILPYDKSRLHLGAFHIEEPDGDDVVDIDAIDLIVVPAVAYDRSGNRLGRGKGYYDRLLSRSRATTVGVCYDFQLVDSIDVEEHDVPVDYIIVDGHGIIRTR